MKKIYSTLNAAPLESYLLSTLPPTLISIPPFKTNETSEMGEDRAVQTYTYKTETPGMQWTAWEL